MSEHPPEAQEIAPLAASEADMALSLELDLRERLDTALGEQGWLRAQLDDRCDELDALAGAEQNRRDQLAQIGDRLTRILTDQAKAHRQLDDLTVFLQHKVPQAGAVAAATGAGSVGLQPGPIVDGLCRLLLERPASEAELQAGAAALSAGEPLESIARGLLLSPDGRRDRRNRARFADVYEEGLPFPQSVLAKDNPLRVKVIDVGAQMLSFMDHVYAPLMRDGRCDIVGFEPLEEEAQARRVSEPNSLMLNHFIGNGSAGTFHINAYNPTSSLFPSNPKMMEHFAGLSIVLPTQREVQVSTTRLDDIPETKGADLLKIDVQGGELDVLKGATDVLTDVAVVHCEVEFEQVYLGQPMFSEIDSVLRAAEFELIDLLDLGYDTYKVAPLGGEKSRLLWADALFVKSPDLLTADQLLKAAYIVHTSYQKYDLAAFYLSLRDERTGEDALSKYQDAFASPAA